MTAAEELKRVADSLPPPPRYDRIAARDYTPFEKVPRVPCEQLSGLDRLTGLPIVLDRKLDANTLELRLGNEVIERIKLG